MPQAPRPGGAPPGAGVAIDPVKLFLKHKWLFAAALFAGAVLGVVSHFVLLRVYPIYTAEVIFECLPPDIKPGQIAPPTIDENEIERFMGTQVDRMQSQFVLERVVRDARLRNEAPRWTARYIKDNAVDVVSALDDIEDIVKAGMVPKTYLVRLSVSTKHKNDSAGIVRLLKENYLEQLRTSSNSNVIDRKDVLRHSIDSANLKLDELNARRTRLVREEELDTLDGIRSQKSETLRLIHYKLLEIQQDLEASVVALERDEAQLRRGTGIQYDNALRLQVDSAPEMQAIKQTINSLESRLAANSQHILPSHRENRLIVSEIEGNRQQLEQTRERLLRDAFESRVDQYRLFIQQMHAQEADLLRQAEELGQELIELTRIVGEIKDIDRTIQATITRIGDSETDLAELSAVADLNTVSRVRVVQTERVPDFPTFPKLYIMIPLGVILVTGLVVGVIVIVEILDQRVKSPADLAAIGRMNVLGIVPDAAEDPSQPEHPESVFRDVPGSVTAEHYRQIRTRVSKSMLRSGHRTLLVVGAMPGSGATSVVSNLGSALIAAGHSVLVIDANYRRPKLHQAFDAAESPGLADILAGQAEFGAAVISGAGAPDLLAAGGAKHRMVEQLGSQRMDELLAKARERYEFVLLDVAPAVVAGDAQALANRCDASMLVVRAMQEKRGMVARLRNELSESRAEFLGAMVNGVRSAAGGYMRKNIRTSAGYTADVVAEPA